MAFNESPYNNPVPIEKTVRELWSRCEKLRGEDGNRKATVTIGLLRRLADYLEQDFEVRHGFVGRISKDSAPTEQPTTSQES